MQPCLSKENVDPSLYLCEENGHISEGEKKQILSMKFPSKFQMIIWKS